MDAGAWSYDTSCKLGPSEKRSSVEKTLLAMASIKNLYMFFFPSSSSSFLLSFFFQLLLDRFEKEERVPMPIEMQFAIMTVTIVGNQSMLAEGMWCLSSCLELLVVIENHYSCTRGSGGSSVMVSNKLVHSSFPGPCWSSPWYDKRGVECSFLVCGKKERKQNVQCCRLTRMLSIIESEEALSGRVCDFRGGKSSR